MSKTNEYLTISSILKTILLCYQNFNVGKGGFLKKSGKEITLVVYSTII